MDLKASVSASEFDEHYEMAYIYCHDKEKNYCFSLSRFPNEDSIQVMVVDQIVHRVNDLSIKLDNGTLVASFDPETAKKLDGILRYDIHLQGSSNDLGDVFRALAKIFEGKIGLYIGAA